VTTLVLETSDGHRLTADLARPAADVGAVRGGVAICHPHPLYGGNRFNPVVDAVFQALPKAGFAAIRFDFRAQYDHGRGERLDLTAALDALSDELGGAVPLFVVGYSFGAMVSLTIVDERIAARVVIAPPIVEPLAAPGSPVLALVPLHDQYAPPERTTEGTIEWPDVEIEVIESADHFLAGRTDAVATRTTAWLREISEDQSSIS
jgi:alpha/beta superfamily hydrolase